MSKTWELYRDNQRIETEIIQYKERPSTLTELRNELAQINKQISKLDSNESSQQRLMAYIGRFASQHDVKVVEIPKTHSQRNKGFTIETNEFKIEGDFQRILPLIYELEYREKLCRVAGTEFKKTIDLHTKREFLVTSLYLQNIKTEKQ